MCNEQAQKQSADHGIASAGYGYVGGEPNYAQGGVGAQVLASPGSKPPSPDPMWMPIASLLQSYHSLRKEADYLKIEVSRHKLRVSELEHERALRIG
jgi:hypothetical protein